MAIPKLATIEEVDMRTVWKDEAKDFTPWLAENISQLGSALGLELELETMEAEVGTFSLDILARDADEDRPVAIENQLTKTDHSHLGQLLTYMAGYGAKTAIWIAQEFRDEHREALDMLNHRTDVESEFYGVVVELWKIGNSDPAPHFRVVSAPNNWGKIKKREHQEGTRSHRYYQFFQGLVDKMESTPGSPTSYKINGKSWQSFKSDHAGFGCVASFTKKGGGRARLEIYIDCGDKEENERRFDVLEEDKNAIESAIGGQLDWERLDSKRACRISVFREGSITDSQQKLDDIQDWMADTFPKFKKTFDPKLAELVG